MTYLKFLFSVFAFLFLRDYCVSDKVSSWQEANHRFQEEVAKKVVLFSGPLMMLGIDEDQLEDWAEEARDRGLSIYIEELSSIVYDAIGAMESFPFQEALEEHKKIAKLLGAKATPEGPRMRYTGDKENYINNRDQFGRLFQKHIATILPKIKANIFNGVMEVNLPDVLSIRHFVDKHWARYGKRQTTVDTPDASQTKWVKQDL